jgi:hypothetical protein
MRVANQAPQPLALQRSLERVSLILGIRILSRREVRCALYRLNNIIKLEECSHRVDGEACALVVLSLKLAKGFRLPI